MSRGRTPMRRIREILRYKLEYEQSHERTACALGVSKGTVANVYSRFGQSGLSWPLPVDQSDSELEEILFGHTEAEKVDTSSLPDVAYLEKELRRPHVTLQLLFEEYRSQHPEGVGRTQFYEHFSRHRSKKPDMKVFHKGGEKLFVDYSGDGPCYIDRSTGEIIETELFVCSWGATSFSYAEARSSQKTGDFVPCHVNAFRYFGVVPHVLVPDNLKSGVIKASLYEPTLNPLYQSMAQHYGCAIIPARVRKPKDKAVVESNVLHIQRFILGRLRNRTFFSLQELNEALMELLEEFNNRPMKDYGNQNRRERFEALERPYAKALPQKPFTISRMRTGIRVAPNYHIRFEDHYYSVPHEFARRRVDVYQNGATLEIYHDNKHVCRHCVSTRKYAYTTNDKHMPPEHAYVKGWSSRYFIFEAGKIGSATAEAVKITMSRQEHAQQGFNAALGILRMAKVYSEERLEKACERALYFKSASYGNIKSILEQCLDKQPYGENSVVETVPVVTHNNIRGAHYYIEQNEG